MVSVMVTTLFTISGIHYDLISFLLRILVSW